MYISAPEDNKIYAYNKVDVQSQTLNFTGDGSTTDFIIAGTIVVSSTNAVAQTQIGVTRNNVSQTAGATFTVGNNLAGNQIVKFTTAPNNNE